MIQDSGEEKSLDSEQEAQLEISLWSRVENYESSSRMLSSNKHCEQSGWET